MKTCWRNIAAAGNSYAALRAACRLEGILLEPVGAPSTDITCYSLNSVTARKYEPEIRGAACITIAGGPYASACYREVAAYADYVVVGEGEHTLPALLHHIMEPENTNLPSGVATSETFQPCDSSVFLDAYPPFGEVKGYIECSRGCPFHCGYCQTPSLFGGSMRHRSIDSIVAYANRVRDARFVTPNAFAYGSDGRSPRFEKIRKLLNSITSNIYFGTFPSEVRPEFICREALEMLEKYCRNTKLHFGAQSGSDRVLTLLHRGHSVSDVVSAVELCHAHGITPVVDFILGLPVEDEEDQRKTLDLIRWISKYGHIHAHQFLPLPGTALSGTVPRPIIREVQQVLGNLALRGKVTGSWSDPEIRFFTTPFE
ncbi:MAG: TIGR04013 family B12-binding domain/radical SAM domain-containing protein [Methanomicrobiales archaeon]|nr:TIGR04013 family B12-binding domain/radical SAM domain-containing protein [Methanomicrobiales archaeon]